MRVLIKTVLFLILTSIYICVSLPGYCILRGKARFNYCRTVTSFLCGIGLRILGICATVSQKELLSKGRSYLLVSNHLSYLDILIISSFFPSLFITSKEMRNTFFLGFMAAIGGSLFVERRSISDIKKEIGTIGRLLARGLTICFFPEATSGDGLKMLPFKSSFIESAIQANTDVAVLCIKYTAIDEKPTGTANLDYVCWYGDMYFFPHLMKLFTLRSVKVELRVLDVIPAGKYLRKEICDMSYKKISDCYFT